MLDSSHAPRLWGAPIDLAEIKTPAYVYSVGEVSRRLGAIRDALGEAPLVSFKACPLPDLLARAPQELWRGVEIASQGELHALAGLRGARIFVNTPALTEGLTRTALSVGATLIIDDPRHVEMLHALRGQRPVAPLMLRLSNRLIEGAPKLRADQFGMDLDAARRAVDLARSYGLSIRGLHLFAGPHTFARASRFVVPSAVEALGVLESRAGYPFQSLDLGGGLEEDWPERGHDFAAYRAQLRALPDRIEVLHEFGHAIFASAGAFVARVMNVKTICGQRYAICDGGLAQAFLLAQTETILRKLRTPRIFGPARASGDCAQKTILCGSTCNRDDAIGETFEPVEIGDLAVFDNCGAYCRTYAPNAFLHSGAPHVYVV